LDVDLATIDGPKLARVLAGSSPAERRRYVKEVDRRMAGRFRRTESERIGAAEMFVALLPESLPVLEKWLTTVQDRWDYELHFSIFCFLGDAQTLPIQPSVLVSLSAAVTRYLSTVRVPTARAAWMAGDLLGVHWNQPEALPALVEVALQGTYAEGREAALYGLERRVDRPTDRATVLQTLRRVSEQDRSRRLRRHAKRILSGASRKRRPA
jgi:hypothetical protein